MYNWYRNALGLLPKIIDKLLSGEDLLRLVIAILALIAARYLIGIAILPILSYLSGEKHDSNLLVTLVATTLLITAVAIAWYNFARWLHGIKQKTDEEILADATLESIAKSSVNTKK